MAAKKSKAKSKPRGSRPRNVVPDSPEQPEAAAAPGADEAPAEAARAVAARAAEAAGEASAQLPPPPWPDEGPPPVRDAAPTEPDRPAPSLTPDVHTELVDHGEVEGKVVIDFRECDRHLICTVGDVLLQFSPPEKPGPLTVTVVQGESGTSAKTTVPLMDATLPPEDMNADAFGRMVLQQGAGQGAVVHLEHDGEAFKLTAVELPDEQF